MKKNFSFFSVLGAMMTFSSMTVAGVSVSPSGPGGIYVGAGVGMTNFDMPNFVYGSTAGGSSLNFETQQTAPNGEFLFGYVLNKKKSNEATPAVEEKGKKKKKNAPEPVAPGESKLNNMRLEANYKFSAGSNTSSQILSGVTLGYINGQTAGFQVSSESNNTLKTDLFYNELNVVLKADVTPESTKFGDMNISFTPYIGPSILILNQKYNIDSVPTNSFAGSSIKIEEELDSKLYGLKFGANANFTYSDSFNLFAGAGLTVLNGNTHLTGKQTVTNTWGGGATPGTYTVDQNTSETIRKISGTVGVDVSLGSGALVFQGDFESYNNMPFAENPSTTQRAATIGYQKATLFSFGVSYIYPF